MNGNTSPAPDLSQLLQQLYQLSHEMPVSRFEEAVLALVRTVIALDSASWARPGVAPSGLAAPPGPYNPKQQARTSFIHWMSLFHTDRTQHSGCPEANLLAQLSPHILQALVLNHMTHLQRDAVADSDRKGLAISDLTGVLHYVSPAFDAMLRAQWADRDSALLPSALLTHFLAGHDCFKNRSLVVSCRLAHDFFFLETRTPSRADGLTSCEYTIAKLIATGASHKKVAHQLERSPATVRNHIQAIYSKLAVNNIAGLINEMRLGN